MNWLLGLAYLIAIGLVGYFVHRLIHGAHAPLTPLGVLYSVWIPTTAIYVANPLGLARMSEAAVAGVAVSAIAFTVVYGIVVVTLNRRGVLPKSDHTTEILASRSHRQLDRMRIIWHVAVVAWLALFILFLSQIKALASDGLSNVLYQLRLSLATNSDPPSGFYYFYFAQIVVPLGAVLFVRNRERRYLLVPAAAAASLILTSGRTNVFIAVISFTFALLLTRRAASLRRQILAVAMLGLLLFTTFALVGNNIGKTYENSLLYATYGDNPPVPTPLIQPLFYVSSPLPYFGALVDQNTGGSQRGTNVARPILQLGQALDPTIVAPDKIQPFLGVPFPTNIGTYLSPIWRDFGFGGFIVENALLGLFCALAYARWKQSRSPAATATLSVVMVFCASSVIDASFSELWFILFLGAIAFVATATGSRSRRVATTDLFWLAPRHAVALPTRPRKSAESAKVPGPPADRALTGGQVTE